MGRMGCVFALVAVTGWIGIHPTTAMGAGRLGGYALRMAPTEHPALHSWGGGLNLGISLPFARGLLSAVVGGDYALTSENSVKLYDSQLGIEYFEETLQGFGRVYIGGQVGQSGRGFIRPHLGLNLSRIFYSISTNLRIPNDADPGHPILRDLGGETKSAFGYDVTAGVDFNIVNKAFVDLGVRYLNTFGDLEQLEAASVPVEAKNLAFYLGAGVNLDVFKKRKAPLVE